MPSHEKPHAPEDSGNMLGETPVGSVQGGIDNLVDGGRRRYREAPQFLTGKRLVERITTEVKGVNRVLYDFTPKPTGTIEYE